MNNLHVDDIYSFCCSIIFLLYVKPSKLHTIGNLGESLVQWNFGEKWLSIIILLLHLSKNLYISDGQECPLSCASFFNLSSSFNLLILSSSSNLNLSSSFLFSSSSFSFLCLSISSNCFLFSSSSFSFLNRSCSSNSFLIFFFFFLF